MLTKVIIKRKVAKGSEKEFFENLKNLRWSAMNQKGYISGETLICAQDTSRVLIISKWETLDDWKNWMNNETRKSLDARLGGFQENPTEYEPYVFSKFRAAAGQGFPPPLQGDRVM